jgi:hypothetical protein
MDLNSARLDCQLPDSRAKLNWETGEKIERSHAVMVAAELFSEPVVLEVEKFTINR